MVEAAGLRFEVFDVPGHSPGHVVYVFRGPPVVVFGGDVLFRGGVGRTDFPGGDAASALRRHPRQAVHAAGRYGGLSGPRPGHHGRA